MSSKRHFAYEVISKGDDWILLQCLQAFEG